MTSPLQSDNLTNYIDHGRVFATAISQLAFLTVTNIRHFGVASKAPFTLRSIFGTPRIKLVPVPLFWFLEKFI